MEKLMAEALARSPRPILLVGKIQGADVESIIDLCMPFVTETTREQFLDWAEIQIGKSPV
jgi:hypothetical protein